LTIQRSTQSRQQEGHCGAAVKSKTQVDFRPMLSPLPDELRRWMDLVIVPILVEQYLREKGAPEEPTDG
jgi:hypothetical protein